MVPEQWPRIMRPKFDAMRDLPYPRLAFEVMRFFADDYPGAELKGAVDRTYTPETFGTPEITPLRQLDSGLHVLGLSNGPTLAFKDIAMQLLGRLFEQVLEKQGRVLNVLGATSGDTGSAAEHALKGKERVNVFMLSPAGRMSPFQRAQMYSLQDRNIFNIAVDGTFDDCQDIVKQIAGDTAFKERHSLGAVNSINWARVVAQVVYYFKGYFAATSSNDQQVSFAVPSATSATSSRATSPSAWGCRSAGWCSPPTRTTSSTNSSARDATARGPRATCRPPRAPPWTSRRRPTSSASSGTSWTAIPTRSRGSGNRSRRRAASTSPWTARGRRSRRIRASCRDEARTRIASRRSGS
jgi:hypothetical protein